MAEQRHQAVLAVISEGLSISQVAEKVEAAVLESRPYWGRVGWCDRTGETPGVSGAVGVGGVSRPGARGMIDHDAL